MKTNSLASHRRRRRRGPSPLALIAVVVAAVALLALGHALKQAGWTPFPTPSPMPSATPSPTPSPAPSATPTPTPSPSPSPIPEPSATPRPTVDPSSLDALPNVDMNWSYTLPSPTFQDIPSKVSTLRRTLAVKYGAIWQVPGAGAGKVVYLSFDEGYEYKDNTSHILDTLKAKGVKATFFVTGTYVRDNPALVRRMVAEGHVVGNHTWTHPDLTVVIGAKGIDGLASELQRTADEFLAVTGVPIGRFMRPPEGHFSERTLAMARSLGYRTVFWAFAYRDWITTEQPTADDATSMVLGQLHDGSVILLHAESLTNTTMLGSWIDAIRARGYTIRSIDEIP